MTEPQPATVDPQLWDQLATYMAAREDLRATAVRRRWESLSKREQRLVREAAVMGYVEGVRSQPGGHDAKIPPDMDIVGMVIDSCSSMPDLYPTIHRAGSRRRA
jgi:hypothetical protein